MRSLFIFIILTLSVCLGCSLDTPWTAEAHNTVTFDPAFSEAEKVAIMEGFNLWHRDTGMVSFEEKPNGNIFIKKATEEEQIYWDKKIGSSLVGLSDKDKHTMYLMTGKIKTLSYLRLVAAHEAGHFLGLEHVPQQQTAVMNPSVNKNLIENPYLTRYDLNIFCDYWDCDL